MANQIPTAGPGQAALPEPAAVPATRRLTITRRSRRPGEWLVERGIFLVSLSAILMVFLIFAFVGREALPVALGRVNNARNQEPLTVDQALRLPPAELAAYLDMPTAELGGLEADTVRILIELRAEELASIDNPDARLNTLSWAMMIQPQRWHGYDRAEYIWQPVGEIPKYNMVPLIIGSLKATLVALLFGVPLGVGAAIYVSQLASPRWRELIKPVIELLAGFPSVVLGFFGLMVMASLFQHLFGYEVRLNALVAGVALGLTAIPIIFTISEDSLTSVPRSYTQAALALGAAPWQVAWQIILPAALPGVFAACVLGFGRAIGETMVVLMASGNASVVSWSIVDSCRTITASIAAELAEVVFGGPHYRVLFLLGALLFAVTFVTNIIGDLVVHRLKRRLEGRG